MAKPEIAPNGVAGSRASTPSLSSQRVWAVLITGGLLRMALSATAIPEILRDRNELVTPLTSWTRLQEGNYLFSVLDQDPYAGGSFHHPPLLLLLGRLTSTATSPIFVHLIWTLVDLSTAYRLARIAQCRTRTVLPDLNEKIWSDALVAAMSVLFGTASLSIQTEILRLSGLPHFRYLFHPFSIATALSLSTSVFSHAFSAIAIYSAMNGNVVPSMFSLSIAAHLSFYPALLMPALVLVSNNASSQPITIRKMGTIGTLTFLFHQSIVVVLSYLITGSWEFLTSVYGVILTMPDLTPNIGISWYFFIEMFDHFRAFFVGVFQLHVLIYVAPLTFAFKSDPLFAAVLLTGVISLFKSYPSLGDFALWHALLASYSELGPHVSHPMVLFGLTLYSLALLPSFHHLWLYSGSGNANFFYASTLVWVIGQGGLLIGVLDAKLKRDVLRELGEEGRLKVRQGKWRIIQR